MTYDLIDRQNIPNRCYFGNSVIKWHNIYNGNGSPKHRTTRISRGKKNLTSKVVTSRKTVIKGIEFRKYSKTLFG